MKRYIFFAFGIGIGGVFGVMHRGIRVHPVLGGIIFATLVWATSYQGWVPALGIMPPASRDEPGRPMTMVLAHWVYGAILGAVLQWCDRRAEDGTIESITTATAIHSALPASYV